MSFSCVDSVFRLVISVGQRKKILILRGSIPYIPYMDPIFFLCPKLVTRRKKTCSSKCNQPDPGYVADNSMTFITPE